MSSTHDSPPSSRPSLSDPPQQDATGLFDLHLKFLTDSYLNFFQERKRIEEAYVDALLRLHRKVKTVDIILDDPIRGDLKADTRVAFLSTLASDVIIPLMSLRETQDRIRKRIKEDLKDAVGAHSDYAENVLPRLKRNYLKRCQDVEDYKAAAAAVPVPLMSPTISNESHGSHHVSKPITSIAARPVVTAPQPLRPLDRRPSLGAPATHARSPSAGTGLQDQAQGAVKKGLNQLMTLLDKGGNMKDFAGRSDNALRSVRAKREADEANKEYRKGVHWLETLRLRRVKMLESGYNSVESFVRESAETVKTVLRQYTDNLIATATTQNQISEHGRRSIEKISSERDTVILGASIQRMLAIATPPPVYYYNYNVGECKDLIFGVTLVDYATARNLPEGEVPKIVRISIREIERRGLDAEGIYRVSGRHAAVQDLQHKIERNEAAFGFNPAVDDVYAIASLLKMYLRELPEPLFKFSLHDRIQHSEDLDEHRKNDFQVLRGKIRRLPPIHQAILKMTVEHLAHVAAHHERNKMDAKNLAIVFGAVIFGEDEMPKGGDLLSDTLAEDLIENAQILFQYNGSPQLPMTPLGETVPPVSYGSSHTKVSKMGPPLSPNRNIQMPPPPSPDSRNTRLARSPSLPPRPPPALHTVRPPPPDDFTPQLPPHPPSSIHPSLRAGPMSALPARQSLPAQPRFAPPPDAQLYINLDAPPARRSLSRDSRSTPRTPVLESAPEEPPMLRREGRATPRITPHLPPRPLVADVAEVQVSLATGSSTAAELSDDLTPHPSQAEEIPERRGEDDALTSASSVTTFASAESASSRGSASTPASTIQPESLTRPQGAVPELSSVKIVDNAIP
ncbi:hypothetical protein IEO21_08394 [Rhodonia placenta]|uniref:Rho-GAP domain-containing protein n=1 Tax=Rhodonia placenta TaxID=104341 RepID=A0A8H7NWH1_9APHY|nr:hypothetical protein IEO21_08394 [Postia placenta]